MPNHTGRSSTKSQDELTLNLNNYQSERTLLVDFELRPLDDSHLCYTYNVLDWPDDDIPGQIMRTTDENLTDDGDIMFSPVLETEPTATPRVRWFRCLHSPPDSTSPAHHHRRMAIHMSNDSLVLT